MPVTTSPFLATAPHLLERIVGELLDAERDALLLDVDVEHLDLDLVALLVVAGSPRRRPCPSDRSERWTMPSMSPGRPTNRPNSVMLRTSPSSSVPAGYLLGEALPRVGHALLEAERDAALGHVDVQHHHFDFLRGRDDLARMDVLLGPAHLGDVDQAFDARLQLHEGAVVGDVGDAALELERRPGTWRPRRPTDRSSAASCRARCAASRG